MARLNLILPDELVRDLRMKVLEVYDAEKGALSKAVAEAIRLWLRQKESPAKKK